MKVYVQRNKCKDPFVLHFRFFFYFACFDASSWNHNANFLFLHLLFFLCSKMKAVGMQSRALCITLIFKMNGHFSS